MAVFDGSAPVADHAFLCEIDFGTAPILWTPYQAGVYWTNIQVFQQNVTLNFGNGCFGHGNFGGNGIAAELGRRTPIVSVGSFFADGEEYTQKFNYPDCASTNKSWFFYYVTQMLYVHFNNFIRPNLHYGVTIGATAFYSNKTVEVDSIPYQEKIIDYAPITKSRDALEFGVIAFPEGSVEISNLDGEFDKVKEQYRTYGQTIRTYIGLIGAAKSDFYQTADGYLSDFQYDTEKSVWTITDPRKKLSRELPLNRFNQTDYPDLSDKNVGKWKPWAFGKCYNVQCMCTDDEASSPSTYTFKIVDIADHAAGIVDIMQVYVDGQAVTHGGESLTAATFTLTATTQYSSGQTVTADIDGFDYDNPFDLIKHILADFCDIAYDATNYDTTEWAAATAHVLATDTGVYIKDRIQVIDLIGQLMVGAKALFFYTDSGKITARIIDTSAAVNGTIKNEEIIDEPVVVYDATIATSVSVGYAKDWKNKSYRWSRYEDEEENYQALYKKYEAREFKTLLVNETDAGLLALEYFNYLKNEKRLVTIQTAYQSIGIELGDLYDFEVNRINETMLGTIKVEIIGIEKDILNGLITLTGREV